MDGVRRERAVLTEVNHFLSLSFSFSFSHTHTHTRIHTLSLSPAITPQVTSPFLVSMASCFETHHYLFFVLPYLSGGTLAHCLATHGGFLPPELALYFVLQISLGLAALHTASYLYGLSPIPSLDAFPTFTILTLRRYGDLKPQNALLDRNGNLRLADFGMCEKMTAVGRAAEHRGTPEHTRAPI